MPKRLEPASGDKYGLLTILDWDIIVTGCKRRRQLNCHYCNAPPSNVARVSDKKMKVDRIALYDWKYQGADRIDSSRPHDLDNVVPCCFKCNTAKMALPYDQFLEMIRTIYRYRVRPKATPETLGFLDSMWGV